MTNGPDYRVRGGELQVVARVTEGLTVQGSCVVQQEHPAQFALLDRQQSGQPEFRQAASGHQRVTASNVFGLQGSPLGESPVFQGNMRVRYEFPLGQYKAFAQVGGQYYGGSWSTIGTVDNY